MGAGERGLALATGCNVDAWEEEDSMAQKRLKIWVLIGGLALIPCPPAMGQCDPNMLKEIWWQTEGEGHGHSNGKLMYAVTGWYARRQSVSDPPLTAGRRYVLTAFVRTSRNMRDGYLGFRGKGLPKPLMETKFGPNFSPENGSQTQFWTVRVMFTPPQTGTYDVFIGLWPPANPSRFDKEAWIEVRDVRLEPLTSGCKDVEEGQHGG